MIIVFWMLSAGFSTAMFFWKLRIFLRYPAIVASLCLVTSTFSHTKIFFTLRRHQNEVQDHVQQPNQTNQLNIARFRKALSTALWLELTLIVCYLPVILANIFRKTEQSLSYIAVALSYTLTLVFLNSSLNPILYCWKIDEVRQAMKETIRQVLCCWTLDELSNPSTLQRRGKWIKKCTKRRRRRRGRRKKRRKKEGDGEEEGEGEEGNSYLKLVRCCSVWFSLILTVLYGCVAK